MFNYEDEYEKATQDAMVNKHEIIKTINGKALFLNMILLGAFAGIGYWGVTYLKNETQFLSSTKVMGVSYTIDDVVENESLSDTEYLKQLSNISNEEVEEANRVNISDALSSIVNTSMKDNSLYTQALSSEIESIERENNRVVLVKKGDTLASLAEKYYGNSMKFNRIIESNKHLNKDSKIIQIGQKLNIPY